MHVKPEKIRRKARRRDSIDAVDRRILAVLVRDAGSSYAEVGKVVNLSAPSVHERVKRLRHAGVIRSTAARLEPKKIGKPLLAFVLISVDGNELGELLSTFTTLPEVEEIHAIAGDHCLIMKVRTAGPEALEELLGRMYAAEHVRATQSYIVLSTKQDRPVQAEISVVPEIE